MFEQTMGGWTRRKKYLRSLGLRALLFMASCFAGCSTLPGTALSVPGEVAAVRAVGFDVSADLVTFELALPPQGTALLTLEIA
jgi:hypothetical protein